MNIPTKSSSLNQMKLCFVFWTTMSFLSSNTCVVVMYTLVLESYVILSYIRAYFCHSCYKVYDWISIDLFKLCIVQISEQFQYPVVQVTDVSEDLRVRDPVSMAVSLQIFIHTNIDLRQKSPPWILLKNISYNNGNRAVFLSFVSTTTYTFTQISSVMNT